MPDAADAYPVCATIIRKVNFLAAIETQHRWFGVFGMIARQNISSTPLPRSVRRALDAMHANVGHGWNVTGLAAVAGVSGRTLQRQFLAFLGKPPHAALRDINFERARRELLRGSAGAKVADVAQRCGFPHGGRFSVEYRRRYGETPSQTLKRQAVFTAALGSMPSFFVPARDRPTVAFGPIEAAAEHLEIAGALGEDLATALTRAGIAVASQPRSARYQLAGTIRGEGAQTRLIFRLIDSETGRQLWAYRSDGALHDDNTAEEHLATRIAAALQPYLRSAEIERALRKPGTDLRRARPCPAGHARRALARCRGQCARARLAGARDGAGSLPRAGDGAGGLGPCPARRVSLHDRAASRPGARHRAGAQGAGAFRRRQRARRARQRA